MNLQELTITPRDVNGLEQNTVNARDLHTNLEVGRDFSTWIKDRIEKYDFIEGEDFIKLDSPNSANQNRVFTKFGENLGGRPAIEYYLTLDMAKEIALVEANSKGKEIRKYFIDYEKDTRQVMQSLAQEQINFHKSQIISHTVKLAICKRFATIAGFARVHSLRTDAIHKALAGKESSIAVENAVKNSLGLDLRELHGKPARLTANG